MNAISARLTAACGAYFAVAVVVGSLGPTRSRVGLMIIVSGLVALLVFLGHVQRLLSEPGGAGTGRGATVAITSTMTACAVVFVATQASELAYFGAEYQLSRDGKTLGLLPDLIEATFVAAMVFFGLFVLCAAHVSRVRRVIPAWLAWIGVVAGALEVLAGASGVLSVESHNGLPHVAALTWIAVVSVLLAVRAASTGRATATASAVAGRAGVAGAM